MFANYHNEENMVYAMGVLLLLRLKSVSEAMQNIRFGPKHIGRFA